MAEYENIETALDCPKCNKGRVNLVISRKDGKEYKFFRCSESDCDWNGGFYNQDTDKLNLIKHCTSCDGILYLRTGRNGPFLGCSKFPDCRHTEKAIIENEKEKDLDDYGMETPHEEKEKDAEEKSYERHKTDLKCPQCHEGNVTLVISMSKDKESKFFRCSNFDCNWNGGFYNRDELKFDNLEYCPVCNGILYEKIGKKGPFMACSNYPKCHFTHDVIKKGNFFDDDEGDFGESSSKDEITREIPKEPVFIETQKESDYKKEKEPVFIDKEKSPKKSEQIKFIDKKSKSKSEDSYKSKSQTTLDVNGESLDTVYEHYKESYETIDTSEFYTPELEKHKPDKKEINPNKEYKQDLKKEDHVLIEFEKEINRDYDIQPRYEEIETELLCPECEEGKVVWLRNKNTGKGHFKCSREDCNYDGGPYSQPKKLLKYIKHCDEPGCKGINYHTKGKYGPYKACTYYFKTGCRPNKKKRQKRY